jgi:uncharacterized protein (DUF952 family)
MPTIYKICPAPLWRAAEAAGVFGGAEIDFRDGFIHFSTAGQVAETAALYFVGLDDLLLVAVEGDKLGRLLRYEPSRGGALFPHLYGPLDLGAVLWVKPLRLSREGHHIFPDLPP